MKRVLLGAVLGLSAGFLGCGKADCKEFGKTWCGRVSECGVTPQPTCETVLTSLCDQATPAACAGHADASDCVTGAKNESCDQILAIVTPTCMVRCP